MSALELVDIIKIISTLETNTAVRPIALVLAAEDLKELVSQLGGERPLEREALGKPCTSIHGVDLISSELLPRGVIVPVPPAGIPIHVDWVPRCVLHDDCRQARARGLACYLARIGAR